MSARPRFSLSGEPPRRVYRGLRRVKPLEQQVQGGVLELLQRLPHEVAWAHKVPAGQFVIVRRDPSSGLSVRSQLESAAAAGYFKKSQIAFIQAAPEGVLDIALGLIGSGAHIELEIKKPGSKPSPAQQQRIDLIRKHGGFAGWVDDVEDAAKLVKRWKRESDGR